MIYTFQLFQNKTLTKQIKKMGTGILKMIFFSFLISTNLKDSQFGRGKKIK
ncbi:hypothetical protein XENTR_v10009576 [Xenopus tropicalis]|nr:hypothetical protein XENTR_v10009576 [Xenopus tropicalis]